MTLPLGSLSHPRPTARDLPPSPAEVRGFRAVLELVLEHRFGPLPADLRERIGAETSAETLRAWHRHAFTARTPRELDFGASAPQLRRLAS